MLVLAGCATPAKDPKQASAKKIEYVYYTPTGSNIAIRVPKDQVQTTDEETRQSQEGLATIQQRGMSSPARSDTGNK